MKKGKKWTRHFLSVIVSLAMVAGMITIPEPQKVSAEGTGLITNGDFETGQKESGYSFGGTIEDTIKHSGTYAAKVTDVHNDTGGITLEVTTGKTIDANKKYIVSAYVYAEVDTQLEVNVMTFDASWNSASSAGITTVAVKAGTWTRIEHTITAADYARYVQPRYSRWDKDTASDGGAFYIDDITLTVSEDTNLIYNGDFETGQKESGYSFGGTIEDTIKHNGTYAAKVTDVHNDTDGITLAVTTDGSAGKTIEANKKYRLSAYVYAEVDTQLEVNVITWDTSWENLSNAGVTTVAVKAGTWTRIDHTITAADYARIL